MTSVRNSALSAKVFKAVLNLLSIALKKQALACALPALFLSAPAHADPLVSVHDFARKNDFSTAKISPNGEYLALTRPVEDRYGIVVLDLKSKKAKGSIAFARGDSVADFWWAGPERIVIANAKSLGTLDQPRLTGELMAMDADGGRRDYLFGYRGSKTIGTRLAPDNKSFGWAFYAGRVRQNPGHILALELPEDRTDRNPRVDDINAYDGSRRTVAVIPAYLPVDVIADDAGTPRFAYGHDDQGDCHFFARTNTKDDWKQLKEPCDHSSTVQLYRMSADGNSAYLAYGEESGRACLREYKFTSDSFSSLSCNNKVDVNEVAFEADTGRPTAVTYEDGRPQTVFPDPENADAKLLAALQNSFKGQRLTITSQTDDGGKLVLLVDSDRNPGDFYLVDRKTLNASYLLSRRSWIDPDSMTSVAPISYQTRDGATINGYLTAKNGLTTKKSPLVLMPHGGPHGLRDAWAWDMWAQLLASRGYAVLQVNYRGSGGYGAAHEVAGYKKWGTLMQDDLTDGVKWAIKQGIAAPNRICIFGANYGGYAALMSAVREPDLYQCAASLAGTYDLVTFTSDTDVAASLQGGNYLRRVLGNDKKLLLEQSPISYITALKIPVLIAHGTEDLRVPFSQAKELRKALQKNGKPFEWMEFDGEEHGFYKDANQEAFLNKLLEFLDKNIGEGSIKAGHT